MKEWIKGRSWLSVLVVSIMFVLAGTLAVVGMLVLADKADVVLFNKWLVEKEVAVVVSVVLSAMIFTALYYTLRR